jgi:hypothetical protein
VTGALFFQTLTLLLSTSPLCQPRRKKREPFRRHQHGNLPHICFSAIPSPVTSASPLSRILCAMRVKSPFSQSALFGFMGMIPLICS